MEIIWYNRKTWSDYFKQAVHLRDGEVKKIKISGINHLRREIMKRFGNDLMFRDCGEDMFVVNIEAADSEGFYQWIAQFGSNLKIENPEECREMYREFLKRTLEQYE